MSMPEELTSGYRKTEVVKAKSCTHYVRGDEGSLVKCDGMMYRADGYMQCNKVASHRSRSD